MHARTRLDCNTKTLRATVVPNNGEKAVPPFLPKEMKWEQRERSKIKVHARGKALPFWKELPPFPLLSPAQTAPTMSAALASRSIGAVLKVRGSPSAMWAAMSESVATGKRKRAKEIERRNSSHHEVRVDNFFFAAKTTAFDSTRPRSAAAHLSWCSTCVALGNQEQAIWSEKCGKLRVPVRGWGNRRERILSFARRCFARRKIFLNLLPSSSPLLPQNLPTAPRRRHIHQGPRRGRVLRS